jgi:hypothetical protein
MPIGYNPSATGDTQLTFPSVADRKRTLGATYLMTARKPQPDIQMGTDQYGFLADANRMANAKVQSTKSAYDKFNRTPRQRIMPTASIQFPVFASKDESNASLERMLKGQVQAPMGMRGGGSIGNLSTPEGQRYARKILDRRAAELTALREQQDTAPVSTERELTEVEAKKTAISLEFSDLLDEIDAGVVERNTAKAIADWSTKFLRELPYYDRTDIKVLTEYGQQLDTIADRTIEVLTDRSQRTRNYGDPETDKFRSLSQLIAQWSKRTANILAKYMGFIDRSLKDRLAVVRQLLKEGGLAGVAKSIQKVPTAEEIANEDAQEARDDPFGFAQPEGAVQQGPPVPDVGDGAEVGEALPDDLPRSLKELSARIREGVSQGIKADDAFQHIVNKWNAHLAVPYQPSPNSLLRNRKATLVQRINTELARRGLPRGR